MKNVVDALPLECWEITIVTSAAMRADGHLHPSRYSVYINRDDGVDFGIRVESLSNLGSIVRTLGRNALSWSAGSRKIPISFGAT